MRRPRLNDLAEQLRQRFEATDGKLSMDKRWLNLAEFVRDIADEIRRERWRKQKQTQRDKYRAMSADVRGQMAKPSPGAARVPAVPDWALDPCPRTPPQSPPIPDLVDTREEGKGEGDRAPGVRAIKDRILAEPKWAGYSEYEAEVTAMEIAKVAGPGALEVIAEAAARWAPTRSIHHGNGIHGYLVAYCANAARPGRGSSSPAAPPQVTPMCYDFVDSLIDDMDGDA